MPTEIKEKVIDSLASELKDSQHVIVTDYQGMTAEQFDQLRAQLLPLGGKYKVVKNRLAKIALDKVGSSDLKDHMKGPSALAYLGKDSAQILKVLFKFGEQNEKFKVKAGRLLGMIATAKDLKAISSLPSREVLIATLLSRLNSPLQGLAALLNEPLRSMQSALVALAKKKEAQGA